MICIIWSLSKYYKLNGCTFFTSMTYLLIPVIACQKYQQLYPPCSSALNSVNTILLKAIYCNWQTTSICVKTKMNNLKYKYIRPFGPPHATMQNEAEIKKWNNNSNDIDDTIARRRAIWIYVFSICNVFIGEFYGKENWTVL